MVVSRNVKTKGLPTLAVTVEMTSYRRHFIGWIRELNLSDRVFGGTRKCGVVLPSVSCDCADAALWSSEGGDDAQEDELADGEERRRRGEVLAVAGVAERGLAAGHTREQLGPFTDDDAARVAVRRAVPLQSPHTLLRRRVLSRRQVRVAAYLQPSSKHRLCKCYLRSWREGRKISR